MGVVYSAHDTRLGRAVAIKMLPAEATADPDRHRRFIQEARAASALNHPHIVTIHEIDEDNGTTFIAMELVDGTRLDRLIAQGPMPVATALEYAAQVASALDGRARQRHRASGYQAGEHPDHPRRPRQGARLRAREARRARSGQGHDDRARHDARAHHGHGRLHVSGAGRRPAGDGAVGHLLARRRALRNALGPPAVRRQLGSRAHHGSILRDQPPPLRSVRPDRAGRRPGDRRSLPRQGSRRPVRGCARAQGRPRRGPREADAARRTGLAPAGGADSGRARAHRRRGVRHVADDSGAAPPLGSAGGDSRDRASADDRRHARRGAARAPGGALRARRHQSRAAVLVPVQSRDRAHRRTRRGQELHGHQRDVGTARRNATDRAVPARSDSFTCGCPRPAMRPPRSRWPPPIPVT